MYDLILKNISKHVTLTADEQAFFTARLKPRKLRKKQYIVQAGDINRYECFVTRGCLRAYSVDDKGQEHVLQFAIEDWWIGDMYSFVTGAPALFNVDALEDTDILLIEKESMEELYAAIPKLERFFRIIIQHAFVSMQRRIVENLSTPADERYRNFIQRYPQLGQRLPQHQIASYLGITPESLSRIRRQLSEKG
jgi:CRP-like cAMP-binding protein